MRRPLHFARQQNATLPARNDYSRQQYSKTFKPNSLKKKDPTIQTVAKLIFAVISLYQIMHLSTEARYWKRATRATATLIQIYDARGCEQFSSVLKKIIHSKSRWQFLYDTWKKHGGRGDPDFIKSDAPPDFVPPIRAGHETTTDSASPRGVFATRDIQKGEMIYGHTKNYAYFASGRSFERFLEDLSGIEACDFITFATPQSNFGPNGETAIVSIMDDFSLMKNGGADANSGCIEGKDCTVDKYALRDIKEGEEIFCDCSKFLPQQHGWEQFGLM